MNLSIQHALMALKNNSDFMQYLEILERQVTSEWENAPTDRTATLAQGQKRLISRIRRDIENAEKEIALHSVPQPQRRVGVY